MPTHPIDLEGTIREFERQVQRLASAGQTPIAMVGATSLLRDLCPMSRAPGGTFVGVIDDDPSKHGRTHAGLEVMDLPSALGRGARSAIITAYGSVRDRLWAGRGPMREAGLYVLTCPCAWETKGWDDCLIEQYEHELGVRAGKRTLYAKTYPPERPVAWEWLLKPLLDRVKPGMSVLEIGSGAGLWTQHVIDRAGSYTAVDYAARLLFEVMEHRFSKHAGRLRLHHDETATLPAVPDASVDVAFSYDVFVHLKSDLVHQYLESLRRVVKPGGTILLHFVRWNATALETWKSKFAPYLRGRGDEMHYNTIDQLRTSAEALGMSVEQVGPEVGWGFLAEFRPR